MKNIPIAAPCMGEEEWYALREPIMNGWLTQGPKVAEFERAFAERHGVKHAIATSSCTTALHLSLVALGIGPGDQVIVPAFTWVATANVVVHCGATPVFVDIDPASYNIDPAGVAGAITPKTKAIIPVHLFGLCADIDAIRSVADGIPIVEDAACAVGAAHNGRSAGSLGRLGCFSFHPRKSITTGEGGMIATDDDDLAERINMLRNHGASVSEEQRHHGPQPYLLPEFNMVGYNYRMTDLQGAVGLAQLARLDEYLDQRRQWAEFYRRELSEVGWLRLPAAPDGYDHGWQAFVCYVDENRAPMPRNELMQYLDDRGISTRPGTHAVPLLGYYRNRYGHRPDDFPHACDCDRHTMAIPLHGRMTAADYHYVVKTIRQVED